MSWFAWIDLGLVTCPSLKKEWKRKVNSFQTECKSLKGCAPLSMSPWSLDANQKWDLFLFFYFPTKKKVFSKGKNKVLIIQSIKHDVSLKHKRQLADDLLGSDLGLYENCYETSLVRANPIQNYFIQIQIWSIQNLFSSILMITTIIL